MLTDTATTPYPSASDIQPGAQPQPGGVKPARAKRRETPYANRPRKGALLKLPSGRTAEGRRLREFRAALVAHVGGQPSATQRALIDRAVTLQHYVARLDAKALVEGTDFGDGASRRYLAWSNSLGRTLALLGLAALPRPRMTAAEALAAREAANAAR